MTGMTWQSGIVDIHNIRVVFQMACYPLGIRTHPVHAQWQGADGSDQQPCLERAKDRSRVVPVLPDLGPDRRIGLFHGQHTRKQIGMPANRLRS